MLSCMLSFAFGCVMGFLAKYVESVPHFGIVGSMLNELGNIGTQLGIWVFIGTVIAVYSSTPKLAAIRVLVFFMGMLTVYYTYSACLFGFFPIKYFGAWSVLAVLASVGGYCIWYSRGKGFLSAFLAALPIGLLTAEGYIFYYTHLPIHGLNLVMALLLFVIVPKTWRQRLYSIPFILIISFIIRYFHLTSLVFGLFF